MRVTLEVRSGPDEGRSFTVEEGSEVRVGRKAPSHVVLPGDLTLSRAHFSVECDGRVCRVRDLGSTAGTEVNGVRVAEAFVNDGDEILAGSTTLVVRFLTPPAPAAPGRSAAALDPEGTAERETIGDLHDGVLVQLRKAQGALYAVLDAARDPLVLARLLHCKEQYQSLYEGIPGQRLAAFAPYLVSLPSRSELLETVAREGWGKSWGIYFTSDKPFKEVRKHLRRFLLVKTGDEQRLYFRYYDPRVLRVFLPTCNPAELTEFFGPVRAFLAEGDGPDVLLRFEAERDRLKAQSVRVAPAPA